MSPVDLLWQQHRQTSKSFVNANLCCKDRPSENQIAFHLVLNDERQASTAKKIGSLLEFKKFTLINVLKTYVVRQNP